MCFVPGSVSLDPDNISSFFVLIFLESYCDEHKIIKLTLNEDEMNLTFNHFDED